jgi:hypothetical protein
MRQEKSPPQGGGLDFDAHKRGIRARSTLTANILLAGPAHSCRQAKVEHLNFQKITWLRLCL